MATQAERENTLKAKIDDLNKVRKQIDDHVDQITRLGTSWITSQGMEGSYQSINIQLESSLDLLQEVLEQMVEAESTSGSFTHQGRAKSPVASGSTLEEVLNRMDSLERKGIALQSQMDETMNRWEHEKRESERRLAEAETQYDQVDKRVQELEKWREEERKEVDELRTELRKMSAASEGGAVGAGPVLFKQKEQGFVASMPINSWPVRLTRGQTVTCLTEISKNIDNHYDPSIGIYTVPVSGRYKITLSHCQCEEDHSGHIQLIVEIKHTNSLWSEERFGKTETMGRDFLRGYDAKLQNAIENEVDLDAGSRLSVKAGDANARLTAPCRVSCVLLKAY